MSLTAAQRKFLELADAHPIGLTPPPCTNNGLSSASRRRMIDRLLLAGLVRGYPHGGQYEITDAGRQALHAI